MKNIIIRLYLVILQSIIATVFLLLPILTLSASEQNNNTDVPLDSLTGNAYCLHCHGHSHYNLVNKRSGRVFRKMMSPNGIIDTVKYNNSNHRIFTCIDCHTDDYNEFPHPVVALIEEIISCVECHDGDSIYVAHKFELIDSDFQRSVHSTKHNESFTCWMCHDPHYYKVGSTTVELDNSMCLNCHTDATKYQLILDKDNPNIIDQHDWLPNQQIHFQNIRCIECHSEVNDSIFIAHNIQSKSEAVKLCKECHSTNSLLRQTLYKYQSKEQYNKLGYFNGIILNESYVIGANRNQYLSIISVSLFILTLLIILIHIILRIRINKA